MSETGFLRFLLDLFMEPPSIKGWIGEKQVDLSTWLFLDNAIYSRLSNVTIGIDGGTTQIDHVILSVFGIFVVETKNMGGWIFGSERDAQWTQKLFKKMYRFQNPLRQNYRHTKALAEQFGIPEHYLFSIVAFVGEAELKTEMPPNVTHMGGLVRYIKSKTVAIISPEEVARIRASIEGQRINPGLATHVEHVRNLRKMHAPPAPLAPPRVVPAASAAISPRPDPVAVEVGNASPGQVGSNPSQACSRCGYPMVGRTARKGPQAGKNFLGCSRYPKCRFTIDS